VKDIICGTADIFKDTDNKSPDGGEKEIEKRPKEDLSIPTFQLTPTVVSRRSVPKCPSKTQPHTGLTLHPEEELGSGEHKFSLAICWRASPRRFAFPLSLARALAHLVHVAPSVLQWWFVVCCAFLTFCGG
jgi:hypothetical protein